METKRLFLGTFVDNTLFAPVYKTMMDDFSEVCTGKWTEIENLHFTYKFLGNVDVEKIPEIRNAIRPILREFKSVISLKGMSCFPNPSRPRTLFVKLFNQEKNIFKSFNKIERDMTNLGFPKEKNKFQPHVSVLRIKTYTPEFLDVLNKYKDIRIGLMSTFKLNLIESKLTSEGPIYNVIY